MRPHVLTLIISLIAFSASADDWWKQFNDPTLDSLVSRALEVNSDVDMAVRRLNIARQSLNSARAAYYPTVGASAGWETVRHQESRWSVGATMSWEIDIFGKITARTKQEKHLVNASRAELEGTRLSVEASVAQAYMDLRTYQAVRALSLKHAAEQKEISDMVQARYDAGLVSRLDVSQSLMVYYSTMSSIPAIDSNIAASMDALATLLNCHASDLAYLRDPVKPLPAIAAIPSITDIDAELMRSRPDIIAAESQIHAAAAALGIARKDYLPSLSLSGSIGTGAHNIKNLFGKGSGTWSLAPTLSWTAFDGFARRAATESAKEQMQIAIDQYNLSLLTGVQEVETAIANYSSSLTTADWLAKTVEQASISREKSLDLYKLNLADFTTVMQAQMSLLTYQIQQLEQHSANLQATISFHKALGQ